MPPAKETRRRARTYDPAMTWGALVAQVGHVRAAVGELTEVLEAALADRAVDHLLRDLELPLVGVLADMESLGIAVDVEHLTELERSFARVVADAAAEATGGG